MLHDIVLKGATDRSVTFRAIDSTDGTPETGYAFNTAGVDFWYRREGGARVAITEVTQTVNGAHTDGGLVHISDGYGRLDLPDAAFATGANHVDFGGVFTGMIVIGGRVRLVDVNVEDTVRAGLTALPNAVAAASGGLFTRGTGAGQINQDANGRIDVNVAAISTDATAADNLETSFDDTAGAVRWNGIVDQGTAQAATGTTIRLRAAAAFADDELNGAWVTITGGSTGVGQTRQITDYVASTDTATVDTWTVTPTGTITYRIWAAPPALAALPAVNVTQFNGVAATSSGGRPEVNATLIEGSDATNQIRDAVVDDATRIDASALNTASGAVPAIKTVTDALPNAGALTDISSGIAALPSAGDNADAVLDEAVADHQSSGSVGEALFGTLLQAASAAADASAIKQGVPALALQAGVVVTDGGNSPTTFKTDLAQSADDHWAYALLLFTGGALIGQVRKVSGYTAATSVIAIEDGFTDTPDADDPFVIVNR